MSLFIITDEDADAAGLSDVDGSEPEPEPDPKLLRKASDPVTPGERLRKIWKAGWGHHIDVRDALLSNPSFPSDLLSAMMRVGHFPAWHNPSVPQLLLQQPLEYRQIAARVLGMCTPAMPHGSSLETLVDHWSRPHAAPRPDRRREATYRALAQRMAELFSLPWGKNSEPAHVDEMTQLRRLLTQGFWQHLADPALELAILDAPQDWSAIVRSCASRLALEVLVPSERSPREKVLETWARAELPSFEVLEAWEMDGDVPWDVERMIRSVLSLLPGPQRPSAALLLARRSLLELPRPELQPALAALERWPVS